MESAFPTTSSFIPRPDGGLLNTHEYERNPQEGMSLRDYFAAQTITGCQSSEILLPLATIDRLAKTSYVIADAMLEARTNDR